MTQTQPLSITEMVKDLEAERDALRARCEAQEMVIARVRSLVAALDQYAADHGDSAAEPGDCAAEHGDSAAEVPAPPTRMEICASDAAVAKPERAPKAPQAGSPHARRYTEADAREWLAELRAGQSCADLWRDRHVAIDTVQRWIKRVLPDAAFDNGRLVEAGQLRPTSVRPGIFGDTQGLEAGELLRAGHSPEAVAAAFGVHVLQMRARLRNLEMDPDSGRFLNRPPEEDLLRERSSHASDDEEAA